LSQSQTDQAIHTQAINPFSKDHPEATVGIGKLAVNLDSRVVTVDDQPVHLTSKQYIILELLNLRKGTIVTREMLFNHLYRDMPEPEPKIIDVFVCNLRKKLVQAIGGDHYIETVWGRGYILGELAMELTQTTAIDRRGSLRGDLG
jgi:two-component system cell cycle response regulator CtrA